MYTYKKVTQGLPRSRNYRIICTGYEITHKGEKIVLYLDCRGYLGMCILQNLLSTSMFCHM